jgi:DNA-binding PadR family transcriptional regulator
MISGDCSCGRDTCTSAGKHPRTKNGVKDATMDEEQIRAWWTQWPTANIGIATGITEGETTGLFVIDVDTHKGAPPDALNNYDLATLLATLRVRTGSGGYHFYLKTEQRLPNTCDRLGPFVDTRGEGGYVVAPPSRNRQGAYTWDNNQPLQSVPAAVLDALNVPKSATGHVVQQKAQKVERPAAPVETDTQADVPLTAAQPLHEARNNYLVSVAGHLRGAGLSAAEIRAVLTTLNEERYGSGRHAQGPLSLEEMEKTIFKSVARWEAEYGVRENHLPQISQLADLMARELPEPNWLVPGLLGEGLVLFAGKPKLGKSWLALSLALACAPVENQASGRALGRYPVQSGGVLYLSLEDSENRFQSRVNKLLDGRPIPSSFGYALSWKPLLNGGLQDLETVLSTAPDTRLVVIDTLARVRTPANGNNSGSIYQEDYALMAALQTLVVRYHLTLILVHHTRKLASEDAFDEISGSTGLTGAADTSLVLKRERGEGDATLHVTGRDVEEQELALTFDAATCTWSVTGKVAERQHTKSRQEILGLLAESGPLTQKELGQSLNLPKGTIYSALHRLTREGIILKESRGRYSLSSREKQRQIEQKGTQLTLEQSIPSAEPEQPVKDAGAQKTPDSEFTPIDENGWRSLDQPEGLIPVDDTAWRDYHQAVDDDLADDEVDWR